MSTRCEIYIRDFTGVELIQLWKHYDGQKEYMVPFFQNFAKWISKAACNKHWMSSPQEVAASLIAYDYEQNRDQLKIIKAGSTTSFVYSTPDIRPKGGIRDAEYVWILNTALIDGKPDFVLVGYRLSKLDGLDGEEIQAIRDGRTLVDHSKVYDEELEI